MKLAKYLWGLSLLLFISCSDGFYSGDINQYFPDVKKHYLYVSSTKVELDAAEASSQKINVQAEETPWAFKGMAPWLTVSPMSGSSDASISLVAKANLSGDNMRTSVFNLTATDSDVNFDYSISAIQRPTQPYVNLSTSELSFSAAQSSKTVQVTSNVSWKMSDISELEWLTAYVAQDSSSITFSVAENASFSGHHTVLNFYDRYWNHLNSLTVFQRVPDTPSFSSSLLTYDAAGGSYSLSLTSQVAWSASTTESWLQVSPQKGSAGTTELIVTALPNMTLSDRSGHVYIKIGDKQTADLVVKQKGLFLRTEPETITFVSSANTQTLNISSNASWSVIYKPAWVTISQSEGQGDAELTLRAGSYWGTADRSDVLKLAVPGTSLVVTVSLVQKSRYFDDLGETVLQFGSLQETKSISVKTDGLWNASVDAGNESWISLSPMSSIGAGTLKITVMENHSDDERTGCVNVTVDDRTQTIAIVQRGKYFTVLPNADVELPAIGGSHTVHISTDDNWTATSSSTWMSLSKRQGKGNIDVNLTAAANNSVFSRSDTTLFEPASTQAVRIITRQAGHYLTVDATALCFFADGKLTDAIHVASDMDFSVDTNGNSWFYIKQDGNTINVTTTKNETGQRREGTIVLRMKELPQGEEYVVEIPVIQMDVTSGVVVIPFGDEQQWDMGLDGQLTIKVTGFSEDADWDEVLTNKLTIKVTTFSSDVNWD